MGIFNPCPCDCSGTLTQLLGNNNLFIANICPACERSLGSSVTITTQEGGVIFESTVVKPSSCVTSQGGTSLVVSGEGLLEGIPVVFTLFLFESISIDQFEIIFRRLGTTGNVLQSSLSGIAQDGDLTITECLGE
ncbi:hypothetical protein [Bacillus dakarensis]|uniref:hypothetical protein n=1 Tax=Robertmurraya dakarensis TaxID=1926278 RepID=UPI0009817854|nr:hypothetical protein [Bacillus dakarensis]